jgi:hypothetical protein
VAVVAADPDPVPFPAVGVLAVLAFECFLESVLAVLH